MADGPVFSPASFTQAYRAYSPEQGNDVTLSTQKASEVQTQTASIEAGAFVADTIAISPAAARMYAEQIRKRSTVTRKEAAKSGDSLASATAALVHNGEIGDSEQPSLRPDRERPDEDDI